MTQIDWTDLSRAFESLFTIQNAILAGLAVLVLLYFWGRVRRLRRPPEVFAFESNRGGVYVTSSAVAELVQKMSLSTEGVAKASSRLFRRKGRLHVHMRVHLRADYSMRDVSRKLEHRLANGLQNTYGIENLHEIRIVVAGIVGEPHMEDDTILESPAGPARSPAAAAHPVEVQSGEPAQPGYEEEEDKELTAEEAGERDRLRRRESDD